MDMCMDMCVDMRIDVCIDVCVDMCNRHMYRPVYGHVLPVVTSQAKFPQHIDGVLVSHEKKTPHMQPPFSMGCPIEQMA